MSLLDSPSLSLGFGRGKVAPSFAHLNGFAELMFSQHWKWPQVGTQGCGPRQSAAGHASSPKKEVLLW